MMVPLLIVAAAFSLLAFAFAFLAWWQGRNATRRGPMAETLTEVMRVEGDRARLFAEEQNRGLRVELGGRLDQATERQGTNAREFRDEMTRSFTALGTRVADALSLAGAQQKERLDNVTAAITTLTEKQERALEMLRQTVEGRLDTIRAESAAKLEEMRKTVDERLQTTLEQRLGDSFNRVVEHLERVHKGIGEVQSLAAGVGDLKKVLSNVKVRGTYGEIQLGTLLEQFLSAEQFVRNVAVKEDSQERVEFAIRLPGQGTEGEVLLPVDSKFPHEDYERLVAASEAGDGDKVAEAGKALEMRIRACARTIREKYVVPPRTTNFAMLFLPTESLYAEALRRPGLFEQLQREFQVTLTGPTTFTALLNALQMGFRTLAIERRSSEVWQILGAVHNEFAKYNEVVDRLSRQLATAANSVKQLGTRTRAMNRTLRNVERLPDAASQALLSEIDELGEDEDEAPEPRLIAE